MFAKSMISLMKGAMFDQEEKNLNNLKKLIDSNTTNYFPEPEVVEPMDEAELDN